MPFIPVPFGVRSSLIYLADSQTIVNTLTFRHPTVVPSITEITALNAALKTWYDASFKVNLPARTALVAINTISLESATGPGLFSGYPADPGTAGPNSDPYNVTWCASLRTALRGRNYRGRFYVPGLEPTIVTIPNLITAAAAAAIQAALGQLMTPANVAGFTWVVASRFLNKLPRAVGVANQINSIVGDLTLDSQRRRLPGRGA